MPLWKHGTSPGSKKITSSSQVGHPWNTFLLRAVAKAMFALVLGAKEAVVAADLPGDIWKWSQGLPGSTGAMETWQNSDRSQERRTHQYQSYISRFVENFNISKINTNGKKCL